MSKTVIVYCDKNGKEPFTRWLNKIKDSTTRRRILTRLRRLEQGNYGVFELRLFFGPGYRIYFGEDGMRIIVLLCAGTKNTQNKDIKKALNYWKEYKNYA